MHIDYILGLHLYNKISDIRTEFVYHNGWQLKTIELCFDASTKVGEYAGYMDKDEWDYSAVFSALEHIPVSRRMILRLKEDGGFGIAASQFQRRIIALLRKKGWRQGAMPKSRVAFLDRQGDPDGSGDKVKMYSTSTWNLTSWMKNGAAQIYATSTRTLTP